MNKRKTMEQEQTTENAASNTKPTKSGHSVGSIALPDVDERRRSLLDKWRKAARLDEMCRNNSGAAFLTVVLYALERTIRAHEHDDYGVVEARNGARSFMIDGECVYDEEKCFSELTVRDLSLLGYAVVYESSTRAWKIYWDRSTSVLVSDVARGTIDWSNESLGSACPVQ